MMTFQNMTKPNYWYWDEDKEKYIYIDVYFDIDNELKWLKKMGITKLFPVDGGEPVLVKDII